MADYPIHLQPLRQHNETDLKDAALICDYVNRKMESGYKRGGMATITYAEIAKQTGVHERRVYDFCRQLLDHTDIAVLIYKRSER